MLSTNNNGTFFVSPSGRTILMYIAGLNHPNRLQHLVQAITTFDSSSKIVNKEKKREQGKGWFNHRDMNGDSALSIACRNSEPHCAIALLIYFKEYYSVDIVSDNRNAQGNAPLDYVVTNIIEQQNDRPTMYYLAQELLSTLLRSEGSTVDRGRTQKVTGSSPARKLPPALRAAAASRSLSPTTSRPLPAITGRSQANGRSLSASPARAPAPEGSAGATAKASSIYASRPADILGLRQPGTGPQRHRRSPSPKGPPKPQPQTGPESDSDSGPDL